MPVNDKLIGPRTRYSWRKEVSVQRVRARRLYKQRTTTNGKALDFQKVKISASIQ
jgi:hypothetical protein